MNVAYSQDKDSIFIKHFLKFHQKLFKAHIKLEHKILYNFSIIITQLQSAPPAPSLHQKALILLPFFPFALQRSNIKILKVNTL